MTFFSLLTEHLSDRTSSRRHLSISLTTAKTYPLIQDHVLKADRPCPRATLAIFHTVYKVRTTFAQYWPRTSSTVHVRYSSLRRLRYNTCHYLMTLLCFTGRVKLHSTTKPIFEADFGIYQNSWSAVPLFPRWSNVEGRGREGVT